ncbi:hypothetical protein F4813DRAFT_85105 [Daldinia decipiens]|uniref:uncharacterized protein n=1 Tax=Daldinia decipiens TaxID=326647 RepID=UPI0020C1E011|nr:uncharacterized protein F4813DRAFT_85105 [Daldinia decipiens]KAI1657285.1 hypothetical protein F4813DRAFT_85105 [Daldinia decipiens]
MGGNSNHSSPGRGRSRHRIRRPTSVSGDDSASPSKHKRRGHSQPAKQNVPIPRINIQSPTPPLSASSSAHHEILQNEQARRIRHSRARETLRPADDGNKNTKDKDKGKGKSISKDRDRDNSKSRTGSCTHIHHHHYHVHNHYHKYYINNDKQVGEPIHDIKHSIYRQPPFDQSDPQAAMDYQEEHHQKHVEQHQDREQQRKQEQKQSQPSSHHRCNSNGVNNPGPSQQRPHQSTRSRSTATRIPGPPPRYPSRPPPPDPHRGAMAAEPAEAWLPQSFTSPAICTFPHRTSIQQDVRNTMDQADTYSATALVNADEEASAIVQANSPRSWTSSPASSSSRASISTLTTISRGVVYGRHTHRRRESCESESGSGSVRRKSKKGGFRAWVSRHLRD